jgi:hypothetical protein
MIRATSDNQLGGQVIRRLVANRRRRFWCADRRG